MEIREIIEDFQKETPIAFKFWNDMSNKHFDKPLVELSYEECIELYVKITFLWKKEMEEALASIRKRIMM